MKRRQGFQFQIGTYMKDQMLLILLHIVCVTLLCAFLQVTGYSNSGIVLIAVVWTLVLTVWLLVRYVSRKRYFEKMIDTMEQVDQRYLLGELMPDSCRMEDGIYRELIRKSNKAVIERIHAIEEEKTEYREYIEGWVHEIKAPITGIELMCENEKNELTRRIRLENRKIENYVDMALYYARSDEVYKDYMIKKTDLGKVAAEAVQKNKQYLIQSKMRVEIDCKDSAYTDEKWIGFILNQLILNSTKYRKGESPYIYIFTQRDENGTKLMVQDNGIGVKMEEKDRIFEKGFTGSNGRNTERSTGMGLYLCQNLCRKLGIGILAESKEGEGTKVILTFPVSSYLTEL